MWYLMVEVPSHGTWHLLSALDVHQTPDTEAPLTPLYQGNLYFPDPSSAASSFSGSLAREIVVSASLSPILQNIGKMGSKLSCT